MDISIVPLTPGMSGAFFRYFEESAFPPGDPRANCYCLESHLIDEARYTEGFDRRMAAKELIDSGRMTGYLFFDGDRPVGWCNAGDKSAYETVCGDDRFFSEDCGPGVISIMYCMDIAEGYQGKGLATMALERLLSDAKSKGYRYVEGYPFTKRDYPWQYHGTVGMYERLGFALFAQRQGYYIYRKELSET